MTSDLYKNIAPNASPDTVWQGKCYLAQRLAAFFRRK